MNHPSGSIDCINAGHCKARVWADSGAYLAVADSANVADGERENREGARGKRSQNSRGEDDRGRSRGEVCKLVHDAA